MTKKVNAAMSDLPEQHDSRSPSFVQRWSQRKRQQHADPEPATRQAETSSNPVEPKPVPISEQDLPPIETLHEDSEVSMFLGEGISETLQRQALRTLFRMGKFNVCDGLDDYADDYNVFQPLQDVLSAQQHLRDMSEQLKQSQADDHADPPAAPATASTQLTPAATTNRSNEAEIATADEPKES